MTNNNIICAANQKVVAANLFTGVKDDKEWAQLQVVLSMPIKSVLSATKSAQVCMYDFVNDVAGMKETFKNCSCTEENGRKKYIGDATIIAGVQEDVNCLYYKYVSVEKGSVWESNSDDAHGQYIMAVAIDMNDAMNRLDKAEERFLNSVSQPIQADKLASIAAKLFGERSDNNKPTTVENIDIPQ